MGREETRGVEGEEDRDGRRGERERKKGGERERV